MTTDELIEVLKQHPGKQVFFYDMNGGCLIGQEFKPVIVEPCKLVPGMLRGRQSLFDASTPYGTVRLNQASHHGEAFDAIVLMPGHGK